MIERSKLYNFTVKDSNKYSLEELKKFAFDMCMDEAPFHGWAPGFTVEVEKLSNQDQEGTNYIVCVYGEFLEGAGPIDEQVAPTFTTTPESFVASPISI
ncbi:MAG: hypothetical protein ACOYL6_08625 [Bacteriovoracaceae bacterium]